MNITPEIIQSDAKMLVGKKLQISLVNNLTSYLWRSLLKERNLISHAVSTDLISLQVYPRNYFTEFSPLTEFEKWAVVEVASFENIPKGMETMCLVKGTYAVFNYQGSSKDTAIFEYIFSQWIPQSQYVLDDRPHFELLGAKYKNNDPNSEEQIWIPVKEKNSK